MAVRRLVYTLASDDGVGLAHEHAQVATHAVASDEMWTAFFGIESNGLVSAVEARDVATSAADALVVLEYGKHISRMKRCAIGFTALPL